MSGGRNWEQLTPRPGLARAPRFDAIRRNWLHLTPKTVVGVSERPARARDEPLRIHHVGRTILVNMHDGNSEELGEMHGRTRVIEVHVGQYDVSEILCAHPLGLQLRHQPLDGGG